VLKLNNSGVKRLNPTCHLLASLGAHHILHVSRIRVKIKHKINYLPALLPSSSLLQLALQPLVGFGVLYDFVPQSSLFTLLSPVFTPTGIILLSLLSNVDFSKVWSPAARLTTRPGGLGFLS
jgi:hypothetical protein